MGGPDASRPNATPSRGAVLRAWESGLALIVGVAMARLAYLVWLCPYTLIEDEAHYWEWSRQLELSYYSKGPGVAWVIRAATELFGAHEWAVRMPAVVFGALGAWCAAGLAREVCSDRRAGLYAAAVYTCIPSFAVLGLVITIDGPYLACWSAACWAGWRALRTGSLAMWAGLGLAIAGAFVFKYTVLLLVPGLVLGAWFGRRDGWRGVRPMGVLVALVCASLGLVPVVMWNAQHDWVTVRHLLGHLGMEGGDMPVSSEPEPWSPFWSIELIGTQAGLGGFAVLLAIYAAVTAYRERADDPAAWRGARYCVMCGLPVLLFYLGVSLIAEPEGNWPIAGYVTAAPLGALGASRGLAVRRERIRRHRAAGAKGRKGVIFRAQAWYLTVGIGVLTTLGVLRMDLLAKLPRVGGLVPLGRVMYADVRGLDGGRRLDALREATGEEPFLIAQHYGRASQMAFYLPGRPRVYSASAQTGGRKTQYDIWSETDLTNADVIAELRGRPAVLLGGGEGHWIRAFERVEPAGQLEGEHKMDRMVFIGYGFRGFDWRESGG